MSVTIQPQDIYNLPAEVYIETGTYHGDSLAIAAHYYPTIHSIEIVQDYYERAVIRFANNPNISIHHGTSPEILPIIIDPSKSTVFFLDAHFQCVNDNETCPIYGECPVLAELQAIININWITKPTIIIDDAACFAGAMYAEFRNGEISRFHPDQWPTYIQICTLMSEYTAKIINGMIFLKPQY